MSTQKELGDLGESLAISLLQRSGYTILAQNYHSAYGEIDIIARCKQTFVFVEVKTRSSNCEAAFSSVSRGKQRKLTQTAECYLSQFPPAGLYETRFDVIAIQRHTDGTFSVNHLQDAFQPDQSSW
jgi:putative endonuclease